MISANIILKEKKFEIQIDKDNRFFTIELPTDGEIDVVFDQWLTNNKESINIEFTTDKSLGLLISCKPTKEIFDPMNHFKKYIVEFIEITFYKQNKTAWDEYFIKLCEVVKIKSKDPSTQIGAVIIGEDNEVLSTGYNSFPRGLDDNIPERIERPEKYYWIEHAERNAIYNAARNGIKLKGSRIYLSSGAPCMDCARAIINSGIKSVYCRKVCTTKNKDKWEDQQNKAVVMLNECGVEVIYY